MSDLLHQDEINININIEEQHHKDDEIVTTNKTILNENMSKNGMGNTNEEDNKLIKELGVPRLHSDHINLSRLNSKAIVQQYSTWGAGDERVRAVGDVSLSELDAMNFYQLSRWAIYHLYAKGDDHNEFDPIAKSMYSITKLMDAINNTNSDDWAQMTREDIEESINSHFKTLCDGVDRYVSNPKHKPNPFFKKGKMRAKLCRIFASDKREEYRLGLLDEAVKSLYKRESDYINDTAEGNFNEDRRFAQKKDQDQKFVNLFEKTSSTNYKNEVKYYIKQQRLEDLNKSLEGKKDIAGNQAIANMNSVILMNYKEHQLKMFSHYELDNIDNIRTQKIIKALKAKGETADIASNIFLKRVEFDKDGNVLKEYMDNDLWNQKLLDTYAMDVGEKKLHIEDKAEDKKLNDDAYAARYPFLRELYTELLSIDLKEIMTKWIDPAHYIKNIDEITHKLKLMSCFSGIILKDSINQKFFIDVLNGEEQKAFDKLLTILPSYIEYFRYSIMSKLFVDPLGNKKYDEASLEQIKTLEKKTQDKIDQIDDDTIDSLKNLKSEHTRNLLHDEVLKIKAEFMDDINKPDLNFRKSSIELLRKQKNLQEGETLTEDEINKISKISDITKSWFELIYAVERLELSSKLDPEDVDYESDYYEAMNLKKAVIKFNDELNKDVLKGKIQEEAKKDGSKNGDGDEKKQSGNEKKPSRRFGKDITKLFRKVINKLNSAANAYLKVNKAPIIYENSEE